MKTIAIALTACAFIASSAAAAPAGAIPPANNSVVQQTHGHGGGGAGGWRPGVGVIVDVPWEGMGYFNPPGPYPAPNQCREARHACFEQWGTDGRGYGRCMRRRGC